VVRSQITREWSYSFGYQVAVSETYSRLYRRVSEKGGNIAVLAAMLRQLESEPAEAPFRDFRAVFNASAVAASRTRALRGGMGGGTEGRRDARQASMATELASQVARSYAEGGKLGTSGFIALANYADGPEIFLATANRVLGERDGPGLRLDVLLGVRVLAEAGSTGSGAGLVELMDTLADRIHADYEVEQWLRTAAALGLPDLRSSLDRVVARIRSGADGKVAGMRELIPLAEQVTRDLKS